MRRLNVVGVKESAGLNVFLALTDFATQLVLVVVGIVLVLSPETLVENVDFGTSPTLSNFLIAIPVGMVAYTGIETISNMAEEARDVGRTIPRGMAAVVVAVFAIYAFLPPVALSALPVRDGETQLALPKEEGGYADDPILGVVENMDLGALQHPAEIYVGILAATILFIATNAGMIGVSRLTYSMGQYRQLPERLRVLHPRFRTPYIAIMVFGLVACADDPPRPGGVPGHHLRVRSDAVVHDRAPGRHCASHPGSRSRAPLPGAGGDQGRATRAAALCRLRRRSGQVSRGSSSPS